MFAKKAQYFLEKGWVWAEDVVIKKFKPDGSLDGQITAKSCGITSEEIAAFRGIMLE